MKLNPPSTAGSQRDLQALTISGLLLLLLIADPRLFLWNLPHAPEIGGAILRGARLWLVCLTVCYILNRLMEMTLHRRIRRAWIYILLWSIVIPASYGMVAPQVGRRWPAPAERELVLFTMMIIVLAFAGAMFKRLADSVSRTSHYDHLTGLPNRVLLKEKLTAAIDRARRHDSKFAVCMLNLDHFKRINDSLSHAGGDAVLLHVARQLQRRIRPADILARIGGDEFVVLIPDCYSMDEAEQRGTEMLAALATPVKVENLEICVTASIGISLFPDAATDSASLLHSADAAMHEAKEAGRGGLHIYRPTLERPVSDRLELEEDFRYALENNELALHYQPQISLATGQVTGMEALLRWSSPKRGNVPPSQFIAIAEEVGLMVPVGEWALRQACRDCVELQKITGHPLTMALNLSARQFSQRNLPQLVKQSLDATGLAPQHLELEITEQMLMVNSPHTLATLQAIRDLGVGIAIDDFGTGFSSFSYILQYHVDRIKIDQSFVARSIHDPNATAIVRTIIAMAHGLNMRVVAEGVETSDQSDFLLRRRCDDAQGYLFARPMPRHEIAAAIDRIALEQRKRNLTAAIDHAAADFERHPPTHPFINN